MSCQNRVAFVCINRKLNNQRIQIIQNLYQNWSFPKQIMIDICWDNFSTKKLTNWDIIPIEQAFSAHPYRKLCVNTPGPLALSSEFEFSPSTCTASLSELVPLAPLPPSPRFPFLNLLQTPTPLDVRPVSFSHLTPPTKP